MMLNTTKAKICGKEYELRASNWACQLYAERFHGSVKAPWNGTLTHDAAQLFAEVVAGPTDDGKGYKVDYVPAQFVGMFWALAAAAESVTQDYDDWFASEIRDGSMTVQEQAEACVEVIDLMMCTFFREQQEPSGEEPE